MRPLALPSFIIFALSRSNTVVNAANYDGAESTRGRVQPKRDVSVSISSSKTEFAANEPVSIDVVLRNNEMNKPARVLNWANPCSAEASPKDVSYFNVETVGGEQALYLGALIKRKAPTNQDYITLKAGEQVSCTINLDEYFQFVAPSNDDIYDITYSVISMQLSNPSNNIQGNTAMESLETAAPLTIQVDARTPPSRALSHQNNIRRLQTGATTFNSCDGSRQKSILEARKQALVAVTGVVGLLTNVTKWGTAARCVRYDEWFGPYSVTRHTELKAGFESLRNRLNTSNIVFDCTCTRNVYAYVYPSKPDRVYLCKFFWNSAMSGTDSKLGTLIHEISHFSVAAGTMDYAYGQSACRALADSDPVKTINNADSHEYIAENTPKLACNP